MTEYANPEAMQSIAQAEKQRSWAIEPGLSDHKLKKFEAWLVARGASVMLPTGDYEVLRILSRDGVSSIYVNKRNRMTLTGILGPAYNAFKDGKDFRVNPRTKHKRVSPYARTLRLRDGGKCFYCLEPVDDEEESVEHLVSTTHGGPNHVSNMFLAHVVCNQQAGHRSAVEKIRIRERHIWQFIKARLPYGITLIGSQHDEQDSAEEACKEGSSEPGG